jgi:DNA-binding IclR family transcriptional regulator
MRHHRNGGPPGRLPEPGSLEYLAQKAVLLELVVDPPRHGDRFEELVERLGLPPAAVDPALAALEVAGLAQRNDHLVRATPPARYFEYLWPVLL